MKIQTPPTLSRPLMPGASMPSVISQAIAAQPPEIRELSDEFIHAERPHALLITNHGYAGPKFPPASPDSGGQITYVNGLAVELVRQGFKVTVATRSFRPDEMFAQFGNRIGVAYFAGHPLARYVYVPGLVEDFLLKEQIFADLPAIGANLAHALHDEAAVVGKKPWEYVSWINSHYWDGGVVGQLLVRAWQSLAPDHPGLNKHAWNAHSIGTLKKRNMINQSASVREEKYYRYEFAALNFPMRDHVERYLIRTPSSAFARSASLYAYTQAAPVLVYTSQEIYDHMIGLGASPDRMIAFPPATDTERYYPRKSINDPSIQDLFSYLGDILPANLMQRMRKDPQSLNIVVEASRMDPTKRKEIPIAAMQYLPLNTILLITGRRDMKGIYDELVKQITYLGLENRVFLLGMVPDHLMGPLMSLPHGTRDDQFRTAIGVGASRMEGWGMAVMDLTAGGLPLISSSLTPYAVRINKDSDAAIVIPVGIENEPRAYAEAIRSLIDDPSKARELGERGRKAAQNFTWPSMVRNFVRAMEKHFG